MNVQKLKETVERLQHIYSANQDILPDDALLLIAEKMTKLHSVIDSNNRFVLRQREAGECIDAYPTLEEAKQGLLQQEANDRKDNNFEENWYEIFDNKTETIIN